VPREEIRGGSPSRKKKVRRNKARDAGKKAADE
jgi:hypothetical protein